MRLSVDNGAVEDVELVTSPETPVGDVLTAVGLDASTPVAIDGETLDVNALVGSSRIREGAILRPASSRPGHEPSRLVLNVVSGPEAGKAIALSDGRTVIGRGRAAGARVDDPELSREHFAVNVTAARCTVEDLGSTNGTRVDDGDPISRVTELRPGGRIKAGLSEFSISRPARDAAALVSDGQGGLVLNRTFRIIPAIPHVQVEWPTPPSAQERSGIPWVATLAPAVIGIVMAAVLRQPTFLLFALLSPITMVATQWSSRRQAGARAKTAQGQYEERLAAARGAIAAAIAEQAARRQQDYPDPQEVLRILGTPTQRIWERRPADRDFLDLRVGLGAVAASVEVARRSGDEGLDPSDLNMASVPVCVPLPETGVLGISGSDESTGQLGRWIAAQIVALQAPDDVQLVVLSPRDGRARWSWLRWAPHCRLASDDRLVWVATDSDSVDARARSLKELVQQREQLKGSSPHGPAFSPAVVVILDGAADLRRRPDVAAILQRGPSVSVFFVCLDNSPHLLPEECRAVVDSADVASRATLFVQFAHGNGISGVAADALSASGLDEAVRVPAAIRRIAGSSSGAIPGSVRLLDLLELSDPGPADVRAHWNRADGTSGVIVGATDGGLQRVDLQVDGPHALIAGMTGSGKSEFIQSLVASLAVSFRPDEMQFVFVDYKGGSAFRELAELPHCGGLVTNLDARLTRRALSSLDADVKRRQQVLAEVGARDHADYRRIRSRRPELEALPRLVIVVDEFAEMKEDLPDFIDGLVAIARVGRSLGVHLILATQRPSGVVSPEIRSNANLRVCLRVASDSDSLDVVDAPDAARISKENPGRAYMRIGSEPLLLFQTARVGGHSGSTQGTTQEVVVRHLRWDDWVYLPGKAEAASSELTDLDLLVRAIREAAVEEGVVPASRPWTEPLPSLVTLDSLEGGDAWSVVVGERDLPSLQRHVPWAVPLDENLLVVGSARSGRTTLVRTLVAAAARCDSPAATHVYVLDGGNALGALEALPHVGVVVPRGQTDRAGRLLGRLVLLSQERNEQLARNGFSGLREQWDAVPEAERLPRIVLIVDRWESWSEELATAGYDELLSRLLSEGSAAGVSVVVAADETVLRTRIPARVSQTLVLRVNDPTAALNLGLPSAVAATTTTLPAGRAILAADGSELQIAVLDDGTGAAESARVSELTTTVNLTPNNALPFRLVALPTSVARNSLSAHHATGGVVLGVGGDEADAVVVEPLRGLVVAGPPRSGRSTALVTVVLGAIESGLRVVVVCPRRSDLTTLADRVTVLRGDEVGAAGWTAGLRGCDMLVIDDVDLVAGDLDLSAVLADRSSPPTVVGVDLDACSMPTGLLRAALKRAQQALLLCPPDHLVAQSVGVRLPRGGGFSGPPGRGVLAVDGEQVMVQVAR